MRKHFSSAESIEIRKEKNKLRMRAKRANERKAILDKLKPQIEEIQNREKTARKLSLEASMRLNTAVKQKSEFTVTEEQIQKAMFDNSLSFKNTVQSNRDKELDEMTSRLAVKASLFHRGLITPKLEVKEDENDDSD